MNFQLKLPFEPLFRMSLKVIKIPDLSWSGKNPVVKKLLIFVFRNPWRYFELCEMQESE